MPPSGTAALGGSRPTRGTTIRPFHVDKRLEVLTVRLPGAAASALLGEASKAPRALGVLLRLLACRERLSGGERN